VPPLGRRHAPKDQHEAAQRAPARYRMTNTRAPETRRRSPGTPPGHPTGWRPHGRHRLRSLDLRRAGREIPVSSRGRQCRPKLGDFTQKVGDPVRSRRLKGYHRRIALGNQRPNPLKSGPVIAVRTKPLRRQPRPSGKRNAWSWAPLRWADIAPERARIRYGVDGIVHEWAHSTSATSPSSLASIAGGSECERWSSAGAVAGRRRRPSVVAKGVHPQKLSYWKRALGLAGSVVRRRRSVRRAGGLVPVRVLSGSGAVEQHRCAARQQDLHEGTAASTTS
jgi:hypothetical protein